MNTFALQAGEKKITDECMTRLGLNSKNFQIIANLPVDIRPSTHTFLPAVGDMMGTQTIRIGALSDGRIQVGVRGTASSYIGINSLIYTI